MGINVTQKLTLHFYQKRNMMLCFCIFKRACVFLKANEEEKKNTERWETPIISPYCSSDLLSLPAWSTGRNMLFMVRNVACI